MAKRLRFTADATTPDVTVTPQSYTHDQGLRRKLVFWDVTSTLAVSAYTPDVTDDHVGVAGDSLHVQFVSDPLQAGIVFTSAEVLKAVIQGMEADNSNGMQLQVFISVVSRDGTTVRATIRSKVSQPTNLDPPSTLESRFLNSTLSDSYTTVAGDRLVVEISCEGTPQAAPGTQGHNASFRFGGSGTSGDLPENSTSTSTTSNPWIQFIDDVNPEFEYYGQSPADADDGTKYTPGFLGSLNFGNDGTGVLSGFMRYDDVRIPVGATITNAVVTFKATSTLGTPSSVDTKIRAVAEDDPTTITSNADFTARVQTTAGVDFDPTAWTTGTFYNSPDIAAVIQEIVDRAGWAPGNALILCVNDDGTAGGNYLTAASSTDWARPLLHVTFTVGGADFYGWGIPI